MRLFEFTLIVHVSKWKTLFSTCACDHLNAAIAVADQATQNIQELVAKQRMPKPNKNAKRNQYSTRAFTLQPTVVLPRRGAAPVAVPAELRTQLRILLSQVWLDSFVLASLHSWLRSVW